MALGALHQIPLRSFAQRIAVAERTRQTTYAELDDLANRFARALVQRGLAPGDRVGLHLARGATAIAAMVGTVRAGGVFVPLDPGSPPSRIALILSDCGIRHLLVSPSRHLALEREGVLGSVEHVFLSEDGLPESAAAWLSGPADAVVASERAEDDLAYILYTSGSTGVPKGIMISHRNALAFVEWAAREIQLGPEDRVASVAPFHFDLSVFDIWSTLSVGACLVVVDESTVLSGRSMLERIREVGISVWYSVPSAWLLMLAGADLVLAGAPSLRVVYFAGEVFPMKQLRQVMGALPGAQFHNLFGPTETNVCLAYALPGVPGENEQAIPIGRPVCGDGMRIVDEADQDVAAGEIGELLIEGPTVMLGYWKDRHLPRAAGAYRTGDMVAAREDGFVMYHGRRDHMVKVHGYRIELGEVEAALLSHPLIREAVASVARGSLQAVLVLESESLSVLSVKKHCAGRLPGYMVPTEVKFVDALPHTSNGKVDRVRIKALLESASE